MSSTIPKPKSTAPLSLAGKPPYATDEPDSFYETPHISPSQRIRAQLVLPAATANSELQNKRTSAYDVYDDYIPASSASSASASPNPNLNPFAAPQDAIVNRNSGLGALLLNMDDMDDDSDDDDDDARRKPAPSTPSGAGATGHSGNANGSKHAALAAAVSTSASERAGQILPPPPAAVVQQQQHNRPPPSPQQQQQQQQRAPQPIAAPQPGYPAPIAALNLANSFPQPQPPPPPQHGPPAPQMRQIPVPPPLRINPHLQNPFEPPQLPFGGGMPSPFPRPDSTSPHPLLPPVTPITPAFIRPAKPPPPASVTFDEASLLHDPAGVRGVPRRPGTGAGAREIIRGENEETLLPSRGEKGDDFWRRFSMVAKLDAPASKGKKYPGGGPASGSSWLARTQSGTDRYARWVWVVGLTLLIVIVGSIACGVYFTRGSPDHQQPKVFGGSADQAATYTSSATAAGKVVVGAGGTSTVLHVSPTNTVARRAAEVEPTGRPVVRKRMHVGISANAKRRLENGVW